MSSRICLIVVVLSVVCRAVPVEDSHRDEEKENRIIEVEHSLVQRLNKKCLTKDTSSCTMLKLVAYVNRLLKKSAIDVVDNVRITQTSAPAEISEGLARSMYHLSDEAQFADLMSAKVLSFVRSRALRLRLLPTWEAVLTSNPDGDGNINFRMNLERVNAEEGRGKQKHMGGMMAMIAMKLGMLAALSFKALVLLVGKALVVSKIALVLAVVIGLKKLLAQKQKHVTYEVVAQPHHSHAHVEHFDHGGHDSFNSGWGRSSDHAHRKAYRGHVQKH